MLDNTDGVLYAEPVEVETYSEGVEADTPSTVAETTTQTKLSYTTAETDALLTKINGSEQFTTEEKEKLSGLGEQVGRKYYVDGVAKGEVFNSAVSASGGYSHAEGAFTTASGTSAHAEGSGTTASGTCSHAEGSGAKASSYSSHAEGTSTRASSENQHVQGKYNVEDSTGKYAFIIGNGTNDDNRSNAFAIDWQGNIYVNNSTTGVNVANLLERVAALEAKLGS